MDANQEDKIARILDDVRHLQPVGASGNEHKKGTGEVLQNGKRSRLQEL